MGEPEPLRPGDPEKLGEYELSGRLGSGGMGIVYEGRDPGGARVAVKVIHPHLADSPAFRTRFRSEATLAARVARYSTAAVLDFDVDGEQPYLVTEFVDGPTLQEVVETNGPLTGGALDALAIGIATALIAIHDAGIVHRDLKPSNVVLSRFGPRVIDFGIARAADVVTGLTTGVVGSPPYMAPEQFRGEPATSATDVHAWGGVVCFAGTGSPPFGVAPPTVMLYRTLEKTADLAGLEGTVRTLAEAALSKDPTERPDVRTLLDTLTTGGTLSDVDRNRVNGPNGGPAGTDVETRVIPPPTVHAAAPPRRRTRRALGLVAGALAVAVVAGVSFWGLTRHNDEKPVAASVPVRSVAVDDHATGPARPVPGARRGGRVNLYAGSGEWRLDPATNNFDDAQMAASRLLTRSLTGYRLNADGSSTLVGDLATDTGRTEDGGRTWAFTLRQGVTFEDGRPVTAADVAHGIARSFHADLAGGPTYLQQWLTSAGPDAFRRVYPGPSAAHPYPPGVTVDGDRGLTLRFATPHPDLPVVASLSTTAAVPQRTSTYPVSTGPYRVVGASAKRLVLGRNPRWAAASDPIRTNYPDEFVVTFGQGRVDVTRLLIADKDPYAVQLGRADAYLVSTVYQDQAEGRLIDGRGSTHNDLCLNTRRLRDVSLRRALSLGFNRESALEALGGQYVNDVSGSLLAPRLPGYRPVTVARTADVTAARGALAGRRVTLRLGYRKDDDNEGKRFADAVTRAFARIGVTVTATAIPTEEYTTTIGTRDNPYDAYLCGWRPDYLDGNAMLALRYGGSTIRATGNTNVSYLAVPAVDRELARLARLPDRVEAAAGYARLEQTIRETYVPAIPIFDQRRLSLYGSAVHEVAVTTPWGVPDLGRIWVGSP